MPHAGLQIDVHLDADQLDRALRDDVRRGLSASPKELQPKWFYDDRGCELFDAITRLEEYYPTECERSILVAHSEEIAAATGATTIIELGSGTSDKTRTLLDAFASAGTLDRFVPFDVNETTVREAATALMSRYRELAVHAVVGDFEQHLAELPRGGTRLIAFLGGTIGNLTPPDRKRFLTDLADSLDPGDWLLLGTDLVKDTSRLERAYDDAAGVTAEFNRNVLAVVNRRLDADFRLDNFTHVAEYLPDDAWIEMRLRADRACSVRIAALDMQVEFAAGEELRTEISAKFRRAGVAAELAGAGLHLERWMTDERGDFALSLARLA